jgi:Leucine Rich repeat
VGLRYCNGITDESISISALAEGCGQLQTIDLDGCQSITDIGVSALGHGCGQLQTINLSDCHSITDIGISALADGCGQLQTDNLVACEEITDIGSRSRVPVPVLPSKITTIILF